ncbi:TlpA family protein disulfide reductase [Flavobacterium haoranii]|uniref:Thioredoxin-like n=1 Tax=Flavobacterium haoranii TaxID=683124 RepID=A0A1M6F7X8_9FLAO|nr:TlpA disulfide reductase family protein [Flavobacterium haoranii]SHI93817.1 Thioredoxin-like [Flavobacterium haoranii]
MKKIALLFVALITLSFTKIDNDKVRFRATIENRHSDTLVIRSRSFNKIVVADKEGNFSDEFSVEEGFYQLFDGAEYAKLYLKNGYDLRMSLNAEKFDESIIFEGDGANENNFLAEMALDDEKFDYAGMLQASETEFPQLLQKRKEFTLNKFEGKDLETNFVNAYKKDFEQSMAGLQAYYNESLKVRKLNGQKSPTFNYENYKGGNTSLDDFKGKYVYVDVWATWCGPCRAEIPALKKLEEHYHGKKEIVFVSISIDQAKDHDKWKKFVKDKELGGVQLFADKDWNSDFVKGYQINGIPRFIIIGPKGEIVNADAPRPSAEDIYQTIDTLLK